jgi:enoyl-CoA hydratase/carnithine racemase
MTEYGTVRVADAGGGVRILTLDRPPVNALGRQLVDDLYRAVGDLAGDRAARCLVIRSAGRHFCGGADLKERQEMSVDEVRRFVPRMSSAFSALADLPFPTIAAIRGAAVGGGCELALACDLRLLAEDATLGLRETALAILPGAGGTQRLPRLIGVGRAKRWVFTARAHSAAEALADGVADRVVPSVDLDREATRWAETIAAHGPVAVRLAKRAIDGGIALPLPDALRFEWECYEGTLDTRDREEGLRAFAEKRPPRFEGR